MADDNEDMVYVKSGLAELNKTAPAGFVVDPEGVALWERDPKHPGGEVFVAGDQPVKVYRTDEVARHLRTGRLIEVKAKDAKADGAKTEGEPAAMAEAEAAGAKELAASTSSKK